MRVGTHSAFLLSVRALGPMLADQNRKSDRVVARAIVHACGHADGQTYKRIDVRQSDVLQGSRHGLTQEYIYVEMYATGRNAYI